MPVTIPGSQCDSPGILALPESDAPAPAVLLIQGFASNVSGADSRVDALVLRLVAGHTTSPIDAMYDEYHPIAVAKGLAEADLGFHTANLRITSDWLVKKLE